MKKIILLISILLLGGCYDYTEIDDISIITGIILDYNNNEYELTTEVFENEKESKVKIYKTTCKSIDLCILEISKESNKELFISHLKTLILTDRTINKDIKFYDYFLRNSKSKMNFYVYYVSDEYKDKIFNDSDNSSLYLKDMTDFNIKDYSTSIKLLFTDMIQKLLEKGFDNIYPSISIKDDKLCIDSLVYSNKELNNNESIIYNILSNNTISTYITIPCDNNSFSLNINHLKTKYKFDNTLNIEIKSNSKLSNYNCKYNLNDKNTIKTLEELANKYITNNSYDLINKSKKDNYDFLGLIRYIYKHSKKEIDLKDLTVKINTNIKINSIGESR